jgi:hypothetical protein
MIESPLIQEIVSESNQATLVKGILHLLGKFGPAKPGIVAGLAQVKGEEKLLRLLTHAANCASVQDFAERLREERPAPPPASTRGKRRQQKPST